MPTAISDPLIGVSSDPTPPEPHAGYLEFDVDEITIRDGLIVRVNVCSERVRALNAVELGE
jgi:hypothetical protein